MTKTITSSVPRAWAILITLFFGGALLVYAFGAQAAMTVTISVTPTSSTPGADVSLHWSATLNNGEIPTCTGTNFSTGGARNGTITVNPSVTTTYTVNCDGVSNSATVTVSSNPPTATLAASPTTILNGGSSTLTWSSTNATTCTNIDNGGTLISTGGATSGSVSVSPSATSGYSITCSGSGGSATASASVTVNQPVSIFQFSVNPTSIQTGSAASVNWYGTNATSCTGTNFSTGGATSGTVSVSPTITTTYSVTCNGAQGSTASQSATLTVTNPAPVVASCSVNPTSAAINQTVGWFGSASGGTAPYSFTWGGENLDGLTAQNPSVSYDSPGTKNGFLSVTDTGSGGTPGYVNYSPGMVCTGTDTGYGSQGDTEDGGNGSGILQFWTSSPFKGSSVFGPLPPNFSTNKQNYCSTGHKTQSCNPNGTPFGTGSCPFFANSELYNGTGMTPAPAGNGGAYSSSWAAATYTPGTTGGPQTSGNACTNSVTVAANAPTATLAANPISIIQGDTSTLTWTSANATSCSIDNGVGAVSPVAGGSVAVTPATTTLYTLTCTGPGGSATAAVTVSVTMLQSDLTAGSISPTSATAGSATTLSAPIANNGSGTTGSGFTDLFQRATDAAGSGATDIGTYASAAIAASAVNTASLSYAFPSAGTWYVRACADKSSAGSAGVITESNENNNCGPWTAVSVAAAAPTGTLSCTVSSQNPSRGTTVTYTATPGNGATGPYTWNDTQGGSYGTGATASRLISGAGPYTMFVSGTNVASNPASCPAVGGAACGAGTATITATPNRVREGQTATISWSATGVDTSCVVSGPGVSQTIPGNSCTMPSGSATPVITAQSVYTIICDGGEAKAQAVVNLVPKFIEF